MNIGLGYELSHKQQLAYYSLHLGESKIDELLYGGAAGGGKTLFGCIFEITRRLDYPHTRGFIARKNHSDLIGSTFKTFKEVYDKIAFPRIGAMNYNGSEKCIYFPNGSEIQLMYTSQKKGDRENQRIGSYEFTDGFCDEAGEMDGDSLSALKSRIRYNLINGKKPILYCSNPSPGYLKETFIKDKKGNPAVLQPYQKYIQAKLYDNPNKEFVKNYEDTLLRLPEFHRKRLLDGDWDYQVDDYDFFSDGTLINIGECKWDEYYPILLAFDFNHNPTTCHVMQKVDERQANGGGIRIIKTFSQVGGTESLCKHIRDYMTECFDTGFKSIFKVCGDHSGNDYRSSAGGINDFEIIRRELGIGFNHMINTNKANPRLVYSRTLCNSLFKTGIVTIHPDCTGLINDIKIAKTTDKGGLYKDRDSGHGMDDVDALRYGIHAMFESVNDIDNWIYAIG